MHFMVDISSFYYDMYKTNLLDFPIVIFGLETFLPVSFRPVS